MPHIPQPSKSGAVWIWLPGARREVDCHLLLRKEFTLSRIPGEGRLRIAVSDQYRLFINGRRIGDGPARSELPTAYVDTYTLEELGLRKGVNCIGVLVHNTMMPQHGQSLVPGGFWLDFACVDRTGSTVAIVSDPTWRVTRPPQFLKPAPRRFFAVGFNEMIDCAAELREWSQPGFDDQAWSPAQPVDDRPYNRLVDRLTPRLRFATWKPVRVRRSGTIGVRAGVWGLPFNELARRPRGGEATFETWLHVEQAQQGVLEFGCDNWARVSVNEHLVWEQGRPDARFVHHLEYDRDRYHGMVHGNGHRYEPGSTRGDAGRCKTGVTLTKGWNRLTIWIWQPGKAYGFEGFFRNLATGAPIPCICSAQRDRATAGTWAVLPPPAHPRGGDIVGIAPDMLTRLSPSWLADWDRQHESKAPPHGTASLLADPRGRGPMVLPADGFIEFQLSADGTGFLELEVKGPPGAFVDVTITEAQTRIRNGRMRSLYNGLHQTDRIMLSGGWDRWESLDRRSGRYIGLCVRNSSGPVAVRAFSLRTQHYPVSDPGRFACSDRVFNRMWEAGAATIDASTFDLVEDCPTREKAQWSGDTMLRMYETAYLWGDLSLSAKAIGEFAQDQTSDQWARPIVPSGYGDKLAEFSLILPRWIHDHYLFTGDVRVVRESFQAVENLLAYAGSLADARGYAHPGDDPRIQMYFDYSMPPLSRCGDTIGAMQAFYVAALDSAAFLADLLGRQERAQAWRQQAGELRLAIRRDFWIGRRGLFVDGLKNGEPGGTYSAVTNYWMLYAGVPDPGQTRSMIKRLWITPRRENLDLWPRGESPFTKFTVSEALLSRGMWQEAFTALRSYYGSMFRHPESMGVFEMWDRKWSITKPLPRNSFVHAFGIGPMAHLAMYVAGIRPLRPGFAGILWEPMPGDLRWMRAEFPLPGSGGRVAVELMPAKSGGRRLVLRIPGDIEVRMSRRYLPEDMHMEVACVHAGGGRA